MKNLLKHSLLILALSAGVSVLAHAQASSPAPTDPAPTTPQTSAPQGQYGHKGRAMNPDRQTRMLSKRLGLSSDQAAQLEPILASRDQQMKALHDNTALDPRTMRQQMRGIMLDTDTKVTALLNDTQKQQYQQMLADRRHGRHGQLDGSQAAPPASPSV